MKNVLESFSCKGKVALVTGGAGHQGGYGAQISEALYEAGAIVYIASRNEEKLKEFAAKYPGMRTIVLDLASEEDIRSCIKAIVSEAGKIDILVNNAVLRTALSQWDLPMEDFDRSMHVNASALFLITRLAAENMKLRNEGSIINIASYMGMLGLDPANYVGTGMQTESEAWPSPVYHYEKGGMINFTRWAASVLGKYNIRVNSVSLVGYCAEWETEPSTFTRNHAAATLLGRLCNSTDLKGGIVYLASDASSFVTGTNLVIDGGYSAK
ncbi:MAG: SDR family oxidoreductase [Oligosphaeraceae bacterium]|nr:SDR family oxidoreductase [Oligosphaeraceae bacterium]